MFSPYISMASSGDGAVLGAGGGPRLYFCYQCNRTVSVTPSASSDPLCPDCNNGFLEEYESPNPFFSYDPFASIGGGGDGFGFSSSSGSSAGFPLVFNRTGGGAIGTGGIDDLTALFAGGGSSAFNPNGNPDVFNPILFLQNYFQTLRTGGANIQFVIESSPGGGDGAFRMPANINLGDYFIGPGLEQLIQQLAENDPNRYGTPPASKSAVENLPLIKISKELLSSDSSQCAICKDTFELGEEAKQMPCKHTYHNDCILPWLELHNSCPVCRYELPTDDPDYEQRACGGAAPRAPPSQGQPEATNGPGSQDPQTVERRFRISLPFPWPFRAFGSPAETSNSGSGDIDIDSRNGNGGGDSNSGNRSDRRDSTPETRQEDVDWRTSPLVLLLENTWLDFVSRGFPLWTSFRLLIVLFRLSAWSPNLDVWLQVVNADVSFIFIVLWDQTFLYLWSLSDQLLMILLFN